MWQKIARRIHDMNLSLAIRNTDVHMQAKDQKRTRNGLQFLHQQLVPLVIENLLVLPARNGMRRSGCNPKSVLLGQRGNDTPQVRYISPRLLDVFADAGADLDHRLDHLGLDLFAENHLPFVEKLRNVRTQLARLRIDDLKLFFYAECELIEHTQQSSNKPQRHRDTEINQISAAMNHFSLFSFHSPCRRASVAFSSCG